MTTIVILREARRSHNIACHPERAGAAYNIVCHPERSEA